jgi:serine/threonine-protein kinase RsbW
MLPVQIKTWAMNASLENVDHICADISAWMMELNLSEHVFSLEILAREALNNAVIHGSHMDAARKIYAELLCDGQALSLMVRDDGPGFNWQAVLQREIVDDHKESGRGIKLYQYYADPVEFNESGNQVILTRKLKSDL